MLQCFMYVVLISMDTKHTLCSLAIEEQVCSCKPNKKVSIESVHLSGLSYVFFYMFKRRCTLQARQRDPNICLVSINAAQEVISGVLSANRFPGSILSSGYSTREVTHVPLMFVLVSSKFSGFFPKAMPVR